MASKTATVMLKGHFDRTIGSPRRSLRKVDQCDMPASNVATMPRTIKPVPNRIAPSCNRMFSVVGADARKERKNPTIPKPNPAMVKVVLIQASVVRSSAN